MAAVRTLVLVASEGEAKILENSGKGTGLRELATLRAADFPDVDQGFTEAPGHQTAAPGMGGHAFTPRESEREARRTTFAGIIIEGLEQVWNKGGHDRMIVAASPRLLGELRQRMPKAMAEAVAADLPKDLLKIKLIDLPGHFKEVADF
jgi:protein required for attachment to host cells